MMKKLIVMGIVAMMVMGLAVAASAAIDTDWIVQFRAQNGTTSQGTITIGTKATGAVDAYNPPTEDSQFPSPTAGYAEISITNGATTRINKDYRAPITAANAGRANAKVWDLVLTINGAASGNVALFGWIAATGKVDGTETIVELYRGAELLWTAAPGASGTSTAPNFNAAKANNFVFDGQSIPLQLRCYTPGGPIVPEPGSMVAMFSGLVGLAGFAIRRRK